MRGLLVEKIPDADVDRYVAEAGVDLRVEIEVVESINCFGSVGGVFHRTDAPPHELQQAHVRIEGRCHPVAVIRLNQTDRI